MKYLCTFAVTCIFATSLTFVIERPLSKDMATIYFLETMCDNYNTITIVRTNQNIHCAK